MGRTELRKYLISLRDRGEREMCKHAWKYSRQGATTHVYTEERQMVAVLLFFRISASKQRSAPSHHLILPNGKDIRKKVSLSVVKKITLDKTDCDFF